MACGVGGRGWKSGGQGLFLVSGGFGYIRELPGCGSFGTVEIYTCVRNRGVGRIESLY